MGEEEEGKYETEILQEWMGFFQNKPKKDMDGF
jgi:hypothetical protein